jgi:ribosomal protein S18 acetylase RimI-like enzyme
MAEPPARARGRGTRSPAVQLRIRKARPADLPGISALLAEAARFARARGHPMWPARFPIESFRRPLGDGELFVGEVGGSLALSFRLELEDLPTWGPSGVPARYLHRLAVARTFAGRGFGEAALRWAARKSARDGARWLRLDTVRSNRALRSYYEGLGFRPAGERRVGGRWLSRFELELVRAESTGVDAPGPGSARAGASARRRRSRRSARPAAGPARKREGSGAARGAGRP